MNRLRELRLKKGLTIKELGQKINIAPAYLSQLETGTRKISRNMISVFCNFYNVKPNEILGYEDTMLEIDENDNEFKENDINMLRAIKRLSDEDYLALQEYISFLIWKHQKKIEDYYDKKGHQN